MYIRKFDVRIYLVSDVNSAIIRQPDGKFIRFHVIADGSVSLYRVAIPGFLLSNVRKQIF